MAGEREEREGGVCGWERKKQKTNSKMAHLIPKISKSALRAYSKWRNIYSRVSTKSRED